MNASPLDRDGTTSTAESAAISRFIEDILQRATHEECFEVDAILPVAYDELRVMAAYLLRGEHAAHTLQPTALAHEAYLRLARETRSRLQGREHLLAVAATVMRRILVDHARARRAGKRGGGAAPVTLRESVVDPAGAPLDILDLHRGLERLAETHPRHVRVVELLFFAGLTHEEAGRVLGVTAQTVLRDWRFAKAWLWRELAG